MADIIAFRGIFPASELAGDIVAPLDRMTAQDVRAERDSNDLSFLRMLVSDKRKVGIADMQSLFQEINETFQLFLQNKFLVPDLIPAVYIVESEVAGHSQKGLWCLTDINDYLSGKIRVHERTVESRESRMAGYFQQTGIDPIPVLLAFREEEPLEEILESQSQEAPDLEVMVEDQMFRIWKITSPEAVTAFSDAFKHLEVSYIADGHHRASAAVRAGFNYLSTVYLPASRLKIYPFHRLVKDMNGLSITDFLSRIRRSFHVQQLISFDQDINPETVHLYVKGLCLSLLPKEHILNKELLVARLDVSLIRDFILLPILNKDDRAAGEGVLLLDGQSHSSQALMEQVNQGDYAMVFLLRPLSVDTIFDLADSGEVLPPKSTFIQPKFPAGLMVHFEGENL